MKRFLILALVLMMALSLPTFATTPAEPAGAAEASPTDDKIAQMAAVVQATIDGEGYTSFLYDSSKARFSGAMSLDNGLKEADVDIYLYDDSIAVYVTPSFKVDSASLDKMAVLTTLINWKEYYATVYMNYENGTIMAGRMQNVESVLPTVDEMSVILHEPIWLVDDYGDSWLAVNSGTDPHEAYQAARDAIEARQAE